MIKTDLIRIKNGVFFRTPRLRFFLLAVSLFLLSLPLRAQTELGSEDDLTVLGTNGTALDPDVEVKGFTVFGSTQAAYAGAVVGPGDVVVNGALAVSSGAYVNGSSTFTAGVYLAGVSSFTSVGNIYITGGADNQVLAKNGANGPLKWTNTSALGDSLGSHIATQGLDLAGNPIFRVSSLTITGLDAQAASLWVATSAVTPHLYVSTTGYVGLGTSSPSDILHIRKQLANVVFGAAAYGGGPGSAYAPNLTFSGTSGAGPTAWDGSTRFYYTGLGFSVSHNATVAAGPNMGPAGLGLATGGRDNDLYIDASGNVGIGNTAPAYRLTVSSGAGEAGTVMAVSTGATSLFWVAGDGAHAIKFYGDGTGLTGIGSAANSDKLDGFHAADLQYYQSDRDFPAGTLIQSDIDYSVANGEPFLLEIDGNSYNSNIPFDIKVQGYIYSGTIISTGGISNGTNLTGLVAFNYLGKLCFWFPSQGYWQGFNVFINDSYGGIKKNRLVSVTNAAKPGGVTKEVAFTVRQSLHDGNFNSYAPTLTGTGASGSWPISITGTSAGAAPSGAAGGNLSGTYPNPSIASLPAISGAALTNLTAANISAGTAGISITGNAASATRLDQSGQYVWASGTLAQNLPLGITNSFVRASDGWPEYGTLINARSYSGGGGGGLQLYAPYGSSYGGTALRFRTADYSADSVNPPWTAFKTILDSGNFNTYAPTLTGTGASGTWPISISGTSAGAAPSGAAGGNLSGTYPNPSIASLPAISGAALTSLTAANISAGTAGISVTGNAATATKINAQGNYDATAPGNTRGPAGLNLFQAYANGYPTTYGNVLHMNGTGGGQLLVGWSGTDGANADNYIRSKRDNDTGAWSPWAKILTDVNYNTYAPTLTGTGASGTWPISITGTSAGAAPSGAAGGALSGTYPSPGLNTSQSAGVTWSAAQTFSGGASFPGSGIWNASGNLGVGTAPSAKFHVHETTALGSVAGNYQLLTRTSGVTANIFMNNSWLYRKTAGADWTTARIHDAVSVDASFLTPGVDTRVWWERDPQNNIQSWGNAAATYMTLNTGSLGIGTPTPGAKLEVAGDQAFAYPTMGLGKGTIHVSPVAGTNDNTAAITFGANSGSLVNSAQAGIYVQSSGAYGTRMYFGTTNAYVTGAQQRMMIDAAGNVGIGMTPGGSYKVDVSGTVNATAFRGDGSALTGITITSANLVNGTYTGGGGLQPPSYIPNGQVRFNMMAGVPGTSGYQDWLMMDTYTGADVPYVTMIGVSKLAGNPVGYLAVGAKGGATWTSTPLITGSNIASQSVSYASTSGNLTAGAAPTLGSLTFSGVGGDSGQPAPSSDYRIYQAPGPWSNPYPDLNIAWHTGISIGAHYNYGGTRFFNNSDMVTELMSVGNGDNNVRVANNLTVKGSMEHFDAADGMRTYKNLASYNNNVPSIVGTMKITMPFGWTNTMMTVTIKGYDYSGYGAWEITVGGYNYQPSSSWVNYNCTIKGTPPSTLVRLGYDGSKNIILLGSTGTNWAYPKLEVSEVMVGYSNYTLGWGSGWAISNVASEAGFTSLVTAGRTDYPVYAP